MPIDPDLRHPEIERYVRALVDRHGKDALHIANQARLSARQSRDAAGVRAWSVILELIAEILDPARTAEGDGAALRGLLGRLDRFANTGPDRK